MENATNFADAKNPNRRANYMKKLKKELQQKSRAQQYKEDFELLNAVKAVTGTNWTPEQMRDAAASAKNMVHIPNHRKSPIIIQDRRRGDRRQKPKTRMHFGDEVHTEWFDAFMHDPVYEGRYKVKYAGAARFVFRYFIPTNPPGHKWQFNRRKAAIECKQPGIGDVWRGLAAKNGV